MPIEFPQNALMYSCTDAASEFKHLGAEECPVCLDPLGSQEPRIAHLESRVFWIFKYIYADNLSLKRTVETAQFRDRVVCHVTRGEQSGQFILHHVHLSCLLNSVQAPNHQNQLPQIRCQSCRKTMATTYGKLYGDIEDKRGVRSNGYGEVREGERNYGLLGLGAIEAIENEGPFTKKIGPISFQLAKCRWNDLFIFQPLAIFLVRAAITFGLKPLLEMHLQPESEDEKKMLLHLSEVLYLSYLFYEHHATGNYNQNLIDSSIVAQPYSLTNRSRKIMGRVLTILANIGVFVVFLRLVFQESFKQYLDFDLRDFKNSHMLYSSAFIMQMIVRLAIAYTIQSEG